MYDRHEMTTTAYFNRLIAYYFRPFLARLIFLDHLCAVITTHLRNVSVECLPRAQSRRGYFASRSLSRKKEEPPSRDFLALLRYYALTRVRSNRTIFATLIFRFPLSPGRAERISSSSRGRKDHPVPPGLLRLLLGGSPRRLREF